MLPVLSNQTEMLLDNGYKSITILGPRPGYWYTLLATDRDCGHAGDQAEVLVAARAEYAVQQEVINIVPSFHNYQDIRTFFTVNTRQTFRFQVPQDSWAADINITKCSVGGLSYDQKCPIELSSSPLSVPTLISYNSNTVNRSCAEEASDECHLNLVTMPDTVHYLTVTNIAPVPVSLAVSVHLSGCREESFTDGAMMVNSINTQLLCSEPNRRPLKILFQPSTGQSAMTDCGVSYKMTRKRAGTGMGVSWSLPGSSGDRQLVHLSHNSSTTMIFDIEDSDIGGNFQVEIAILTLGAPNEVREVIGCLTPGYKNVPYYNGSHHVCDPRGRMINVARSGIHREMMHERMIVMYPSAGTWLLSLVSHCSMAGQGRRSLCSTQAVTAVVSVTGGHCVPGCGKYGKCKQHVTAGLTVISSCKCLSGYRGPLCNDGSLAESDYTQLTVTLILSITNLSLLPAIMLSLYRKHYTECMVYWCQLVAGCIHHACVDSVYSVCLGHSSLLHYADMLSDQLSVWVTVLSMAYLPHSLRSVLHITGGVTIATAAHFQHNLVISK